MYFSKKVISLLIFSQNNLGNQSCNFRIMRYIHKKTKYGYHMINLLKSYRKIMYSLSVILVQPNLNNIALVDVKTFSQLAAKKFCKITGIKGFFKNFYSGSFTNNKKLEIFKTVIVAEPKAETRVIHELKSTHIPIIAFCNTDNSLRYLDFPIILNTNSKFSSTILYYVIAKIYTVLMKKKHVRTRMRFKDFMVEKKIKKQNIKKKNLRRRDSNPSLTGESHYIGHRTLKIIR
uniref:Ribosomal protein S0 n=1 Tax=Lotharella vacuolata TaxID=74820 RepID=A0A0H5BK56_9EUKA|nr:ribosomal protein S0 [Lotharella vacuolata]